MYLLNVKGSRDSIDYYSASETFEERLDVKLKEAKNKARLPGFRPGNS